MGATLFSSDRSRLGVAGVVFIAMVLVVAGCTRQSSNETSYTDGTSAFETEYDSITKGAGADQPVADTSRFFDGSRSVKINYTGTETCPGAGCGEERGSTRLMYTYSSPGFPDGQEGYLGGAFFLPRAFPTLLEPQGYIELFRWDNYGQFGSSADKGGIAVSGSPPKGRLFWAETVDAVQGDSDWHPIGPEFAIPFGRWSNIYIHQRLQGSSNPAALNEVFVNSNLMFSDTGTQNSEGQGFDRLVWGLPQMDSDQIGDDINYWFDRAYASNESPPPAAKDPNVLVIVTDDQRWGQTTSASLMPNLRKWFKVGDPGGIGLEDDILGGQEITNTYAATPECCPSRASILTGLYAHNHGIRQQDVDDLVSQDALELFPNRTLPHYLQDERNYQTGIFGKYLNGWDIDDDPPDFNKFSIFGEPHGQDYCPFWVRENGQAEAQPRGVGTLSDDLPASGDATCDSNSDPNSYSTTYFGNEATEFIEQAETNDTQPWFLYLAPYAPHPHPIPELKYDGPLPGGVVPEHTPAWHEDTADKPPYVDAHNCCIHAPSSPNPPPDEPKLDKYRADQLRTLRSVDDVIGQVFSTVRARGEENNTLAIFVSDNGYIWGEHWLEGKLTPYTYSARVPMFMRWPGRVAQNTNEARLASTVDIAPTVLDALEPALTPDEEMDGRSLLNTAWTRQHLLLEYLKDPDIHAAEDLPSWEALRGTNWQYTRTDNGSPGNYFKEYYTDLPNMLTNLYEDGVPGAGDPPPKDTELNNAINCHGTTPPTACP